MTEGKGVRKSLNFHDVIKWEPVSGKLMQLEWQLSKIRSKLYSNQLLIDFFDPNLGVQSIVATISIRNPDYLDQFQSKLVEFNQN